jgi:hypothetical protein
MTSKLTEDLDFIKQGKKTPKDTMVRIWAGMDPEESTAKYDSLAGREPGVVLYDAHGVVLNEYRTRSDLTEPNRWRKVKEGSFIDIEAKALDRNVRAEYIMLNARKSVAQLCDQGVERV